MSYDLKFDLEDMKKNDLLVLFDLTGFLNYFDLHIS